MRPTRRLWQLLAVVFVLSFAVLGWIGREIYLAAPPIPATVATTTGEVLFTGEDIRRGQQAWLSAGGQQLGSVWGHGSYVAPDWSADWLHREALELRELQSRRLFGESYSTADPRAARRHRRATADRDAQQWLRPRDRHARRVGRARHGNPLDGGPLRRPVRRRAGARRAARAVRDDGRHPAGSGRPVRTHRILLLDVLVRLHRPSR